MREIDYIDNGLFLNEDERFILSKIEDSINTIHPRFEEKYNMFFKKEYLAVQNYQRCRLDIINSCYEKVLKHFKDMYKLEK